MITMMINCLRIVKHEDMPNCVACGNDMAIAEALQETEDEATCGRATHLGNDGNLLEQTAMATATETIQLMAQMATATVTVMLMTITIGRLDS